MIRGVFWGLLVIAAAFSIVVRANERAQPSSQSGNCKPQFAPLRDTATTSGASDLPMWRREEAAGWRGAGWLGWSADGQILEPVQLIVGDVTEPVPDYAELTVQSVPQVDFAVRCVTGLHAGPIQNLVTDHDLVYDGPLHVALGNSRYTIQIQSARQDLTDSRVVLTLGRRSQVLYSANGFVDEPHYDVKWAGDLDHDGRLDLVVNLNRKYSWHPYRLLLSSRASQSQLVGQAAVFETGD